MKFRYKDGHAQGTRLRTREPRRIKKLLRHTVSLRGRLRRKRLRPPPKPTLFASAFAWGRDIAPAALRFCAAEKAHGANSSRPPSASIGALPYPGRAENNIPPPRFDPVRRRALSCARRAHCGTTPFLHTKKPTGSPARRRADQSLRYFLRMSVGDTFITFLKLRLK